MFRLSFFVGTITESSMVTFSQLNETDKAHTLVERNVQLFPENSNRELETHGRIQTSLINVYMFILVFTARFLHTLANLWDRLPFCSAPENI